MAIKRAREVLADEDNSEHKKLKTENAYKELEAEKSDHVYAFLTAIAAISNKYRCSIYPLKQQEYQDIARRLGLNIWLSAVDMLFFSMLVSDLQCCLELICYICSKRKVAITKWLTSVSFDISIRQPVIKNYMPFIYREKGDENDFSTIVDTLIAQIITKLKR